MIDKTGKTPAHRKINCMMMHLPRKESAYNSDTFGRYKIHNLRGTFLKVIIVEQAEASNIPPQKKVQSLLSWLPVSALDLADQAHGTTPDMGTVLHTWPNGRFVQIQDGFRSKETLGPLNGAHFPWSSLGISCISYFNSVLFYKLIT